MSTTRRELLVLAAVAGQERSSRELLEDLLGRERRLAMVYEAALRRDAIEPALGELLLAHERAHLRGLERTLRRAAQPEATVPDAELNRALADRESFALYALQLESDALGAYDQVVPDLRDPELRKALGSIMACIGTHQVALRRVLDGPLVVHPR